ncbi:MAG: lysozyme inhibitor LprI family protein [Devosiaceae bacterium]|nr:lysozyme inhibitor LprI family protein [Devosiaceae bacterium]
MKQTFNILILFLALLVFAPSSLAQEYNCNEPMFQQEMNYCSYQDFLVADKKLNIEYAKAIRAMRKLDSYNSQDMQGAEEALRKAQRLWVGFRDAACEAEGFLFRGGTMEPMIISGCKTGLTRERIKDLQFLSGFDE